MNSQSSNCRNEYSRLSKMLNWRLPNRYKKIGYICAAAIFIFLLGYKFYGQNTILVKDLCRSLVLLFVLIASLSKDPVEDEYVRHVRAQSYVLASVFSALYTIGIPLIALLLDMLITKITGDGSAKFYEISAFEIIFMLVCNQLLFFETLKRFGLAK